MYTKIVGVAFNNTGGNSENRQNIIADQYRKGLLNKGQRLSLLPEPQNPYGSNAIAIIGADGRQLGYLSKTVAASISSAISSGKRSAALVECVTGGDINTLYGVNIQIVEGQNQLEAVSELPRDYPKESTTSCCGIYTPTSVEQMLTENIAMSPTPVSKILAGEIVKRRGSRQKSTISKIENDHVYFTDGWLRSIYSFLDHYEFLDKNNLDVFKSGLEKGIWKRSQPIVQHSSRMSFKPYSSIEVLDDESYYEMESDTGPDLLTDYYDEYHSYD